MRFLIALLICGILPGLARRRYDGYRLVRGLPYTDIHLEYLLQVSRRDPEIDFWIEPSTVGREVDVLLSPNQNIEEYFLDMPTVVLVKNVQEHFDAMYKRLNNRRNFFPMADFCSIKDIDIWFQNTIKMCPENYICSYESIGDSYEGRPIMAYHFRKDDGLPKEVNVVAANFQGRDWLSTYVTLHFVNTLSNYHREYLDHKHMGETYDWWIIPIINPDGYHWSYHEDPLWRKNRRVVEGNSCLGVSIEHNFNWRWNDLKASSNPCSGKYKGAAAESEPETQAYSELLSKLTDDLLSVTHVHAYGRTTVVPWCTEASYRKGLCEIPANHEALSEVLSGTHMKMKKTHKEFDWFSTSITESIDLGMGNPLNYVHHTHNPRYSFAHKFGELYFQPLGEECSNSARELWEGVVYMLYEYEKQEHGGGREKVLQEFAKRNNVTESDIE